MANLIGLAVSFLCTTGLAIGSVNAANGNLEQLDNFKIEKIESSYNDPKKVTVLTQSKDQDKELQEQLDNLLEEFMAQMDQREVELSFVSSQIINSAFDFYGVRYRYGGTTENGIDCSGLVLNAFSQASIDLPRRSLDMAKVGEQVEKVDAQKGDLIFFKTKGSRINHVGIITEVSQDEIKFIHSSTTRGVIVSSTKENYYHNRFVQINRVLDKYSI
ncbi:C40 family peptidase [Myroides sp. LJL115]